MWESTNPTDFPHHRFPDLSFLEGCGRELECGDTNVGESSQQKVGPEGRSSAAWRQSPFESSIFATTTMSSKYKRKGRNGVPLMLATAIQPLNLAKDVCPIAPAQVAFGSASALLTMIRVGLPLLSNDGLLVHVQSGFRGQQTRLRGPWTKLRRRM